MPIDSWKYKCSERQKVKQNTIRRVSIEYSVLFDVPLKESLSEPVQLRFEALVSRLQSNRELLFWCSILSPFYVVRIIKGKNNSYEWKLIHPYYSSKKCLIGVGLIVLSTSNLAYVLNFQECLLCQSVFEQLSFKLQNTPFRLKQFHQTSLVCMKEKMEWEVQNRQMEGELSIHVTEYLDTADVYNNLCKVNND